MVIGITEITEITERTPQIINSIKDYTGRMLLYSSVEIGRRMTEAKSMVEHGEWGKWLENSVSYSQSTANKLMRLHEEYGAKLSAGQDSSNSESIPNLSYTQAIILLGIPEEERESFNENFPLDNSTIFFTIARPEPLPSFERDSSAL
ncbi:Protein of unknown function [Desulfosporosinus lacus DSM 15449]|uniref:Uncharacterized protein n=1 Tax=Desulfosporosinus lacus DSM 15449 TaxID=1121420 RepID=A0A1M6FA42_9FIRM|nr:Protein of unknown function [Desulfosporosinus lacus DSM 15449]